MKLMLRPIVRFALKGSHTVTEFIEIVKTVFVQIAEEELRKSTEKVNVSRISVLTGVHRRDVDRIFNAAAPPRRQTTNVVMRVIGQWEQNRRFRSSAGKPKVLTYKGDDSEFHVLVRSIDRSVHPGTVLFELKRAGLVEESSHGLKLLKPVYRLNRDLSAGFEVIAEDTETLMQAAIENIFGGGQEERNLHIRTEYNNLFKEDLPTIRAWFLREGKKFHKRAREFLSKYDKDVSPVATKEAGGKAVITAFSLIEDK